MTILGVPATAARAQNMPSTLSMSCAEAERLVSAKGGIVLSTGRSLYDRYVSGLRYCNYGETLKPEWVPTRDKKQCFIGYTCIEPDWDDNQR